jgi:HAD superfamily hydrolase (TIGR01509 family)
MKKIKAVFFDRDNTLTYKNPKAYENFFKTVESISGKSFELDNKKMFATFDQIKAKGYNTNTLENEIEFYKQYYKQIIQNECGENSKQTEQVAKQIFEDMWLKDKCLFSDVIPTFKELKKQGIKIGIISDTTLSLQKSLEALGVGDYIDCYTSSKEVGVMKPDPQIYLSAIKKLDLSPEECIYVDDYIDEVVGAKKLGFYALRINREECTLPCDISSLAQVLLHLDKN